MIRQPVTAAKFMIKCSLFILLPGIIRLPKPKPTIDIQPIFYPSPRHIAKPHVARRILSPAMKMEDEKSTWRVGSTVNYIIKTG